MGWAKKGGRRWTPLGGFNPPATEGVPQRAGSISSTSTSNTRHQHRNSTTSVSEIFEFPLSIISPQEGPVHRKPAAKKRKSTPELQVKVQNQFRVFSFKNDIEKTSKKPRKSRILASQSHPKIPPKSCRNRRSQRTLIFSVFFA